MSKIRIMNGPYRGREKTLGEKALTIGRDAEAGIQLGENVAIAMLQDYVNTFAEDFAGFSFTRVDGTPVKISSQGSA